jgi:ribonuclease D
MEGVLEELCENSDWDQEHWDDFLQRLMSGLIQSTKASNRVGSVAGSADGLDLCSSALFKDQSRASSEKIVQLMVDIGKFVRPNTTPPVVAVGSVQMGLPDDLLNASLYEHVVDMIDYLLDVADSLLTDTDDLETSGAGSKMMRSMKLSLAVDRQRLLHANVLDIPKPQLAFLRGIDNSRERPFKPVLRSKPHSIAPLNSTRMWRARADDAARSSTDASLLSLPDTYYAHPYETELKALVYSEEQMQPSASTPVEPQAPGVPGTPGAYPLAVVATEDALQACIDDLNLWSEISIDLEHHAYRSFQGITCLMQISTRVKDYIVDTLALREHMELLGDVFANPAIVKVLHGCDKDVLWLQRDCGLYLVNCFDTYHAAKLLKFSTLSLAHLLRYFCGVTVDKQHQLADWRQRPLPPHLVSYAQSDTHYLLYIYDRLRIDVHALHGREGIVAILDSSRRTCLRRYEKPPFWGLGYRKLFSNDSSLSGVMPSPDHLAADEETVMGALWNWRDMKAREQDESLEFIMSNAELLRLGKARPQTEDAVRATGPLSREVNAHLPELVALIVDACSVQPTLVSVGTGTKKGSSAAAKNRPSQTPIAAAAGAGASVALDPRDPRALVQHLARSNHQPLPIVNAGAYGRALRTPTRELMDADDVVIDACTGDVLEPDPDDAFSPSSSVREGPSGGVGVGGNGNGNGQSTVLIFTPVVLGGGQVLEPFQAALDNLPQQASAGDTTTTWAPLRGGELQVVTTPKKIHSGSERPGSVPSPVMHADEIYRRAGWITPTAFDRGRGADPESVRANAAPLQHRPVADLPRPIEQPLRPGGAVMQEWSSELDHMAASKDGTSSTGSIHKAPAPAPAPAPAAAVAVSDNKEHLGGGNATRTSADFLSDDSVPKSFAEIYEISNRNRKRNTDRKRVRDCDDGDNGSVGGGDTSALRVSGMGSKGMHGESSAGSDVQHASLRSSRELDAAVFDESVYFTARAGDMSEATSGRTRCNKNGKSAGAGAGGAAAAAAAPFVDDDAEGGVLDMVQDLGWIDGSNRATEYAAHTSSFVVSHADDAGSGSGGGSAAAGSAKGVLGKGSATAAASVAASEAGGGAARAFVSDGRGGSGTSSSFDYGSVASMGSMSGVTGSSHGAGSGSGSGRGSGRGGADRGGRKGRGNHGNDHYTNPYLTGACANSVAGGGGGGGGGGARRGGRALK